MAADKGFEKAEGNTMGGAGPAGEGPVEHEGAKIDEKHHGWAPDSGQASEANKQAGDRAFESREQSKESTSERTNT